LVSLVILLPSPEIDKRFNIWKRSAILVYIWFPDLSYPHDSWILDECKYVNCGHRDLNSRSS